MTDKMSHSQFQHIQRSYPDMHSLIFEMTINTGRIHQIADVVDDPLKRRDDGLSRREQQAAQDSVRSSRPSSQLQYIQVFLTSSDMRKA